MSGGWIVPDWPAPAPVKSLITTRSGGVSRGTFDSFNLGDHVGDAPEDVAANRAILRRHLPDEPVWLRQVHGTEVVQADVVAAGVEADGAQTAKPGTVCAVMTADCLPILICDRAGRQVAAAHAGWRGLSRGVIEGTIAAMQVAATRVAGLLGAGHWPGPLRSGR